MDGSDVAAVLTRARTGDEDAFRALVEQHARAAFRLAYRITPLETDPDRAVPMIDQILAGNGSVRVKENALFVLSQSRSPQARQTLVNVARGTSNPELQLRALRHLGVMGGAGNLQILDEVYRTSSNQEVKRTILRSYMVAHDQARLVTAAQSEASPNLRDTAIQQLGVLRANTALSSLYQSETDADVKKRVLQALFVGGTSDTLIDLARTETNADLKRAAVRDLGLMNASQTGDALKTICTGSSSPELKNAVVEVFFIQRNPVALVDLARAEKDRAMKKTIVSRLSLMRSPEATSYLMELLK
jgi:HEAT repeats